MSLEGVESFPAHVTRTGQAPKVVPKWRERARTEGGLGLLWWMRLRWEGGFPGRRGRKGSRREETKELPAADHQKTESDPIAKTCALITAIAPRCPITCNRSKVSRSQWLWAERCRGSWAGASEPGLCVWAAFGWSCTGPAVHAGELAEGWSHGRGETGFGGPSWPLENTHPRLLSG